MGTIRAGMWLIKPDMQCAWMVLKCLLCRDDLVKTATGTTAFGGVTYQTTAELLSGVMPAGSEKVNHGACLGLSVSWII